MRKETQAGKWLAIGLRQARESVSLASREVRYVGALTSAKVRWACSKRQAEGCVNIKVKTWSSNQWTVE